MWEKEVGRAVYIARKSVVLLPQGMKAVVCVCVQDLF